MKSFATGLLVALSSTQADAMLNWDVNGLRTPTTTTSAPVTTTPSFKFGDNQSHTCAAAHCSEIGALLTETCKKNSWKAGHPVMVYHLAASDTCFCACTSTSANEFTDDFSEVRKFLPDDLAEAKTKEVDNFRPLSDTKTREWAESLLEYFKNFFPEVTFRLDWENNAVNAYANKKWGKRYVTILGGLVRYKNMDVEGLAVVLAHELAHHYGGAPYWPGTGKMSCEGQADYIGVRDLMRKVYFGDHYVEMTRKGIPQMAELFNTVDDPTIPSGPGKGCDHPPGPCRIATYYTALTLEHPKPDCADH